MIDVNSNCSRVDAVKAAATQLKLQSGAVAAGGGANAVSPGGRPANPASADAARKVKSDLQSLDTQIKADDAQKAELALAMTKKDVAAAKTVSHQQSGDGQPFRGLDVYA